MKHRFLTFLESLRTPENSNDIDSIQLNFMDSLYNDSDDADGDRSSEFSEIFDDSTFDSEFSDFLDFDKDTESSNKLGPNKLGPNTDSALTDIRVREPRKLLGKLPARAPKYGGIDSFEDESEAADDYAYQYYEDGDTYEEFPCGVAFAFEFGHLPKYIQALRDKGFSDLVKLDHFMVTNGYSDFSIVSEKPYFSETPAFGSAGDVVKVRMTNGVWQPLAPTYRNATY